MSDQAVILPKWSPYVSIILAKGQVDHSYTFWTMPILIFSPVQIIMRHPLCQQLNWTGTLNRGIYYVPWFSFWMPACIFRIVSTLHPQQSWGPAGLNFMQPCNFTHWSTRSSLCSCTCDWHPLNGSLLYTLLTPFCCSKTPQKNSPLYTVRNKNSNVFAEFDSEKLNAVYYLWPDNFEEICQKAK